MIKEKKILLGTMILAILLIFTFTQAAFGFPNEPTGFHGNKWGTPIEDMNCGLEKILSIEKIKIDIYSPEIELKTCQAMVIFLDDKFAVATIKINSLKFLNAFLKLHIHTYGKPTEISLPFMTWIGQIAIIEIDAEHGIAVMGSPAGVRSVESLFDWYESKGGKVGVEDKKDI